MDGYPIWSKEFLGSMTIYISSVHVKLRCLGDWYIVSLLFKIRLFLYQYHWNFYPNKFLFHEKLKTNIHELKINISTRNLNYRGEIPFSPKRFYLFIFFETNYVLNFNSIHNYFINSISFSSNFGAQFNQSIIVIRPRNKHQVLTKWFSWQKRRKEEKKESRIETRAVDGSDKKRNPFAVRALFYPIEG